jgi:hypothetical protein
LPATGQAIEDLMRPDQDESYDRVRLLTVMRSGQNGT